jgi:hypothetical protein
MKSGLRIQDSEFAAAEALLRGYLGSLNGYLAEYLDIVSYLDEHDPALAKDHLADKVQRPVQAVAAQLIRDSNGKPALFSRYIQDIDACDRGLYE